LTTRVEDLPGAQRGLDGHLGAVRSRLPLICALSVAFGIAMGFLSFIVTPVYRGTTVLAPADTDKKGLGSGLASALGSAGGFAAMAGLGLGGSDYATEEAIAVLKSQQFTQQFIEDNNLLPELFPKLWDAGTGHWKSGIKKIPTLGKAYHAFERIRKIEHDTKTGLITLRVEWKDPVKAANWANQLAERLNTEMRTRALSQAEASLGYLQKETAGTVDVTTREAISHLMESQIKQEMLAHVTTDYALHVVDKAIPADIDAPVRPIKVLYIAVGLVFGAMVGIAMALWLDKRKSIRRSELDGYRRSV
jgi:capsular polysaccharide biosynthesis protein